MTARQIEDEVIVADHPVLGARVALVLPIIPEAAPCKIREGIARRRIAATTGQCPCGATIDYGDHQPGHASLVEVRHEHGCPAVTKTLIKAIRRWCQ